MSAEGIGPHSVRTTSIDGKAPLDSEINSQPSTGKAFQRSVQIRESDPRAAMPRSRGLKGIPLGERKTRNAHLTKEGFFSRLKSWLFKKPTETDQFAVRTVFNNLLQAYEGAVSCPGDSDTLHVKNGIVAKAGSVGHQISSLLVDVGLARFVTSRESGHVQIEISRPNDLQAQVRLTELLFESVPLELSVDGKLDWAAMMTNMQPQVLNNLLMTGALKNNGSGWKLASWNPEMDRNLKQYVTSGERANLEEGMQYWSDRLQRLAHELTEDDEKSLLVQLGSLIHQYPERHTEIDERLTRTGRTQSLNRELQQCRDELAALLKKDQQVDQRLI